MQRLYESHENDAKTKLIGALESDMWKHLCSRFDWNNRASKRTREKKRTREIVAFVAVNLIGLVKLKFERKRWQAIEKTSYQKPKREWIPNAA